MGGITICGMTLYQICWYFFIYSFGGWIVEVIYQAVTKGKVINRGFLNGPVCPIYGFGVVTVFMLIKGCELAGLHPNGLAIYIFGLVLATFIELAGGWILDKCFHARWWDYSDQPFNFRGYICLKFSLLWGLAILMIVRIFQNFVDDQSIFHKTSVSGCVIIGIMLGGFVVDVITSVLIIKGFNEKLKLLDSLQEEMLAVSDRLSEAVGESTLKVAKKIEDEKAEKSELYEKQKTEMLERYGKQKSELSERYEKQKSELSELYEKQKKHTQAIMDSLTAHSIYGYGHLLKAFPYMKHRNHPEIVSLLRKRMEK